jgi:ribosomal protein S18 acetylase RimI-like enzyme
VSSEVPRVRGFQPDDLDALYDICVLTADSGLDATPLFSDPKLPGHIYAAPYAVFEPEFTFVAEDASGVGGYVVGALDSPAFADRLEREWWPGLRVRYPLPSADDAAGMSLPERQARDNIHHPWGTSAELTERFPSHLHINLVPRLQGRGLGRQLIETLVSSLRAHGSRGLHLFVGHRNQRAVAFYGHVGFTRLPADDVNIFAMDLKAAPGAAS